MVHHKLLPRGTHGTVGIYQIHIRLIPPEIMESYNLNDLVNQYEWIYMEIIQELYGENHKRELKKNLIAKYLSKHGYYQVKQTPGLCKHV